MISNSVNFGFKKGINKGNSKNKKVSEPETETKTEKALPPKPPVDIDLSHYPSSSDEKRVHSSFLLGVLFGTVMGGAVATGYNDAKTNDMLKDMVESVDYGVDSVFVKDLNNDNVPEIILQSKDGVNDVYDLNSKKIYMQTDDGLVEKM
jgi:hypothetical protein